MKQLDLFKDDDDLFIEECENFISELESKIEELEEQERFFAENQAFEWNKEFPQCCDEVGNWIGFDAIVGNPPYFSLQFSKFNYKAIKEFYKTFDATGDIYSLFIERAIQILHPNGELSFIVSNRFCNTEYGSSTRKFMSNYKINSFVISNETDLFENANVGTLIFNLTNKIAEQETEINIYKITELNKLSEKKATDLPIFCRTKQKYFTDKHWIFQSSAILSIKNKMDNYGKAFCKVSDLKTYRGITTGLNNVFIINENTKENLIKAHKSSETIIKPLLRGGNIKNYFITKPKEWIIFTRRGIDIEKFPAIKKYLEEFKEKLEPGKGRKKGIYKWYEIQDSTAYYNEFEKEKIIWGQISAKNHFAISIANEYSLNSTFIATGKNLKYYCAILNSKVFLFYVKLGAVIWGKDGIKWLGDYFFNSPIITYNAVNEKHKKIENLVTEILCLKKNNPQANIEKLEKLEKQIDKEVYKLYNLSEDEIKIIENETA